MFIKEQDRAGQENQILMNIAQLQRQLAKKGDSDHI